MVYVPFSFSPLVCMDYFSICSLYALIFQLVGFPNLFSCVIIVRCGIYIVC